MSAHLTPRQAEIVAEIVASVPVKQIGEHLEPPVTVFAVRRQIERIAARLDGPGPPLHKIIRECRDAAA